VRVRGDCSSPRFPEGCEPGGVPAGLGIWMMRFDGGEVGDTVLLIHGFFRTERDMFPMRSFLREKQLNAITISLPTTFKPIEQCTQLLIERLHRLSLLHKKIHLVGHSMGGLVLLNLLSRAALPNYGRCVLIGTPVNGSELADIAYDLSPRLTCLIKGLASLRKKEVAGIDKDIVAKYALGVIAGARSNRLARLFFGKDNDGRVSVESTKFKGMRDFIELPYGHTRIHHERLTSELVINFLHTGAFKGNITRLLPRS
jgi:pimeloyl-ACP methyl ester carboxylesterase